jgi:hypothetical protein
VNEINQEQGAFKTIGWKNHQPVDVPRLQKSSRFSGLPVIAKA